MGRHSMLIKHILIALKEYFPRARALFPQHCNATEAVLTTLHMLMSFDKTALENQILTRNSLFDRNGGQYTAI